MTNMNTGVNPARILYSKEKVTSYKGHTIVTMHDQVDHDWSFVLKPGTWTLSQMQSPVSGDPTCATSFATRELALERAHALIDGAAPSNPFEFITPVQQA